jgi:very-short-patch-repair endonuclease
MTIDYICSEECKRIRKQSKPKKISILSIEYWTNRGLTIQEATEKISELQKIRSTRCVEYWINRGYSEKDAKTKVSEIQGQYGKRNLTKYTKFERQCRTPFAKEYWMNRGLTEEQAIKQLSKNSDTTSLEYFINRYGDEGQIRYKEMCDYRKQHYTLSGFQSKHGNEFGKQLWSKKFKNRHNSKTARLFFSELLKLFEGIKIYTAANENGEYGVLDKQTNNYYFYDFVVPELKLCIEFHGDYWHCNPAKYDSEYLHKQSGKTAKEIWAADKRKQDCLLEERGFKTMVIWESTNTMEAINNIKKVIKNEFTKDENKK